MSVDIVLATYNGDRFLDAQIQSILTQDYPDWRLLIRDDGSCDRTIEIIQDYLQKEPNRLQRIDRGSSQNLGVIQNFNYLLTNTTSDYIFLCDQDDVWQSNKLSKSLAVMQQLEQQWGQETPILVFSDLTVVTDQMKVICPSFWQAHNLDPHRSALQNLLLRNMITGCTVMINQVLKNCALPIPNNAFMHDWWLGLVAASCGKIGYLSQPTVLYRQHENNQVGAQGLTQQFILSRLQQPYRIRAYYQKTIKQAQIFLERYGSQLDSDTQQILCAYATLNDQSFWQKRSLILKYGLFDTGWMRNLALLTFL
jgi:glycosyltransferase involved in cell wall biosynthesis